VVWGVGDDCDKYHFRTFMTGLGTAGKGGVTLYFTFVFAKY
jgi:hypothetical protein